MLNGETEDVETTEPDEVIESTEQESEQEPEDPTAGLKKALAAARKDAKDASRELKATREQLADKDRAPEEAEIERLKREARAEGASIGNQRLVRAELKAALTGKVNNPLLALKLIDASGIDVDDGGEVDSDAVSAVVAALLADAPELAVKRFQGSADQGAAGKEAKPSQLTREDLKNLTPNEIIQAEKDGRLNALKGIK